MVGLKIVARTIGLVFLIFLCTFMYSCGAYERGGTSKEFWFDETSPDGDYSIYCNKITKAPPFSKQKIEFSVGQIGKYKVQSMQVLIDNKGKELDESNFEVKWTEKGVVLTFNGLGQSPVSYVIEWEKAFPDFNEEQKYWEERL